MPKFWIGKALELIGMATLPWAVYHGETGGKGALGEEIVILAAGGLVFAAGYFIERS